LSEAREAHRHAIALPSLKQRSYSLPACRLLKGPLPPVALDRLSALRQAFSGEPR
jgi:hypothetical protein